MTLNEYIKATGLPMAHWARIFGMSRQQLNHYTSGRNKPSIETAAKIERLTGGVVKMQSWTKTDD